jgi:hypothetical protein
VQDDLILPVVIDPKLSEFDALLQEKTEKAKLSPTEALLGV